MKKILRIIALVMVVSLMASCCSCQNKNEYAFYVSTKGGEGADGSAANPFATLEQARDAVRKIDKSAYDKIKVLIEPGDYRVGSLKFTAEDSGTKNCPVVYTANGDGEVVINGGITISPESFTKVTDEKTKNRLAEAVRDRVVCTDLKALGLTEKDWGKLYAIGSYSTADKYDGDYVGDLYCELYVNDSRMTMARYPNNGEWLYTGEVLQTGDTSEKDHVKTPGWKDLRNPKSDVYALDDALAKRIAGWAEKEDVWMFGYPGQDWADESSPIGTFDAVKKTLSPKFVSRYEPKANAPYYFYNVLEELDSEGEWYLDRKNGLLYLYTPENFENATVDLALTTDPVISCEKTDNLSFENLTIKGSRGTGISLSGNRDTVQGCTVKNVSGLGIYAEGTDCLVSDCEICQIGKGGVELQGGDEVTLEAGNNVCENCFIHDWSQIYMTYQAGVSLRGVGNICAHNEMKNSPHLAIKWSGNNHIIEYNEVSNVCQQSDDAGAIYSGKSWVEYGNVIRYNYIHDIGSFEHSPNGIYLDDALSGHTVYGNVLVNIPSNGLFLGGGRDLDVRNNILVNCGNNAIKYDQRAIDGFSGGWFSVSAKDGELWQKLKKTPYTQGNWKKQYPQMQKFNLDYSAVDDPNFPPNPAGSTVTENMIVSDMMDIVMIEPKVQEFSNVTNNPIYTSDFMNKLFVNAEAGDYSIRDNAPIFESCPDFEKIPFKEIGRKKTDQ